MVIRTRRVALAVAALVIATSALPASAATPENPNRFVSGWIPYWQVTSGSAPLSSAGSSPLFSEVSLFGSTPSLNAVVGTAHANGLPVFLTLFSDDISVFMTSAARTATINSIVNQVVAGNYDGADIDYEFVWRVSRTQWPTITPQWVTFVRALGNALHAKGKLLSVTVPPVWDGGSRGYTVYAQEQIHTAVDRLRLMVYDWSITNPGPIAPNTWVNSVISYSTSTAKVPPKKLQLGVPAYGRHWWTKKVSTETCPDGALKPTDSIMMKEAAGLAASAGVTAKPHSSGETTFAWDERVTGLTRLPPPYVPSAEQVGEVTKPISGGMRPAVRLGVPRQVTCTVRHVVFVPDATTIRTSAQSALAAGWSGITIWALGYETDAVYAQLNGVTQQRPNGPPALGLDPLTTGTGTIRATGFAYDPEFDLPIAVRLTVTPPPSVPAIAARTITADASRAALPAQLGPHHGFASTYNITAPGTYQVCARLVLWGGVLSGTAQCRSVTVTP